MLNVELRHHLGLSQKRGGTRVPNVWQVIDGGETRTSLRTEGSIAVLQSLR